MTTTGPEHPLRANFPDLTDEEFQRTLMIEEATAALMEYLRQRCTEIATEEGRDFTRNPHFPFPIGPTAREIAALVVDSFGSFDRELRQEL